MPSLGCAPYDAERTERLQEQFQASTALLENVLQSVLDRAGHDSAELATVATGFLSELTEDADHVVATSSEFVSDQNVIERSVRMAVLGMAIGIQMGSDARCIREIGLAGLVHDWGMFGLAERLRDSHEPFGQEDWREFMRHPTYTADLLERMQNVPTAVRIAAYQVHEQVDGSGYPRGLGNEQIHPYECWPIFLYTKRLSGHQLLENLMWRDQKT